MAADNWHIVDIELIYVLKFEYIYYTLHKNLEKVEIIIERIRLGKVFVFPL